jgi:hypothetical protein
VTDPVDESRGRRARPGRVTERVDDGVRVVSEERLVEAVGRTPLATSSRRPATCVQPEAVVRAEQRGREVDRLAPRRQLRSARRRRRHQRGADVGDHVAVVPPDDVERLGCRVADVERVAGVGLDLLCRGGDGIVSTTARSQPATAVRRARSAPSRSRVPNRTPRATVQAGSVSASPSPRTDFAATTEVLAKGSLEPLTPPLGATLRLGMGVDVDAVDRLHGGGQHVVGPRVERVHARALEARVVPVTGQQAVLDGSLREREPHVRAAVVDRVHPALVAAERYRPPPGPDRLRVALREGVGVGDAPDSVGWSRVAHRPARSVRPHAAPLPSAPRAASPAAPGGDTPYRSPVRRRDRR